MQDAAWDVVRSRLAFWGVNLPLIGGHRQGVPPGSPNSANLPARPEDMRALRTDAYGQRGVGAAVTGRS